MASDDQQTRNTDSIVRTFGQRNILFDNENFFNNFSDWEESVAIVLAQEAGLTILTKKHWQVINFLRSFYAGHGRAPLHSQLKKGTGMTLLEMERLFPEGIKYGARRLAGLPNPKTCN